jgi:hypothetical protein
MMLPIITFFVGLVVGSGGILVFVKNVKSRAGAVYRIKLALVRNPHPIHEFFSEIEIQNLSDQPMIFMRPLRIFCANNKSFRRSKFIDVALEQSPVTIPPHGFRSISFRSEINKINKNHRFWLMRVQPERSFASTFVGYVGSPSGELKPLNRLEILNAHGRHFARAIESKISGD